MSITTEIERLQLAKEDIKSAIVEKGGTIEDGALIDTYGNAIRGISDSYYDEFWDSYQNNGNAVSYYYAFAGKRWNDNTFRPKYDIKATDVRGLFMESNIVDLKALFENANVEIDLSKCTELNQTFYYASKMTSCPTLDVSTISKFNQTFRYCNKIDNLEFKNIQASCVFDAAFMYCYALKNFKCTGTIGKTFIISSSSGLTDESVQNIIDCLADLTGQTTQTLTFHADVKAKLTDEQIASITSKNWTLA